jgi:hypothetical protein
MRTTKWECGFCFARNDDEAMTNCCASAGTCPLIREKPGRDSEGWFVVTTTWGGMDEET